MYIDFLTMQFALSFNWFSIAHRTINNMYFFVFHWKKLTFSCFSQTSKKAPTNNMEKQTSFPKKVHKINSPGGNELGI